VVLSGRLRDAREAVAASEALRHTSDEVGAAALARGDVVDWENQTE